MLLNLGVLPYRRNLLVYHKASLVATRDFWRLLTRDKVPLDRLGHSFTRMEEMESKAEATYKMVLDRYPNNAKLLRSYGKFLESIKVGLGWDGVAQRIPNVTCVTKRCCAHDACCQTLLCRCADSHSVVNQQVCSACN